MTNEQEILLALVREGLKSDKGGDTPGVPAFSCFKATELFRLAHEQGMTGIAWTGYERLHGSLPPQSRLPVALKLQWYAAARNVEESTTHLFSRAASFAETLNKEGGLKCVVLKGIDYALLYPRPAHREFGDLDCWLCGESRRGDDIARKMGMEVDDGGYKHSHIPYKGLMVENHHFFTSHNNTDRGRGDESLLQHFLQEKDASRIRGTRLLSPPPAFSALFLLCHANKHFVDEGIRLRHITDWMLFVNRHHKLLEREDVRSAMKAMRTWNFALMMTAFSERHLGLQPGLFPASADEALLSDFTRHLFHFQLNPFDRRPLPMAKRILRRFRHMWKYRQFLNEPYWLKVANTFLWASMWKRNAK